MKVVLEPIGFVCRSHKELEDDNWGGIVSEIIIKLGEQALLGIESFSHAEVIFYFDRVEVHQIV